MKIKKIYSLFYFLFVLTTGLQSQSISPEVIAAAGESYQGQAIQLDWTLGEVAIATIDNQDQLISQGFHQPYFTISNISELPPEIGTIDIFPNPTFDWIQLNMHFEEKQSIQAALFDVSGQLIWQKKIKGQIQSEKYSLKNLPSGSYFLKVVLEESAHFQTFQINKI